VMIERLPSPETYAVASERIRCLCALFDASVTSNARTVKRNNLPHIKGADLSKHLISFGCNAWDLVCDKPVRRTELANAARNLGFWVQIEADHVHLQSLAPGPGAVY
jgi:hypothetical protein